jgi:hypothetical protein
MHLLYSEAIQPVFVKITLNIMALGTYAEYMLSVIFPSSRKEGEML